MREQLILELLLNILADWLKEHPSARIIERAQTLEAVFPDHSLPDWVGVLAGGNPDALDSVIQIAQGELESEDDASDI